ncbi:MAG: WG repeat-containing protein [Bryobacteraceae bacterium]
MTRIAEFMTDDIRRAYDLLELSITACPDEVKAAYRDLVKIWHPDRFQNDSDSVRSRAERKLKEITAAYERLQGIHGAAVDRLLIPMDFGHTWGYVDEAGKTAIQPEYYAAREFVEGLAAVLAINRWGFIDSSGVYRVTPLYEDCSDFSEGLAAVKWYNRWGYIDRDGAFVIQPRFQSAGDFRDGWAEVKMGARAGRVSRAGEIVFDAATAGRHIEG